MQEMKIKNPRVGDRLTQSNAGIYLSLNKRPRRAVCR